MPRPSVQKVGDTFRTTWTKGRGGYRTYLALPETWGFIPGDWLSVTMYGNGSDRPDTSQVLRAGQRQIQHGIMAVVSIPESWYQAIEYNERVTFDVRSVREAALPQDKGGRERCRAGVHADGRHTATYATSSHAARHLRRATSGRPTVTPWTYSRT